MNEVAFISIYPNHWRFSNQITWKWKNETSCVDWVFTKLNGLSPKQCNRQRYLENQIFSITLCITTIISVVAKQR